MSQPQQQQSYSEASAITLLLADHEAFGFSERSCYHFDLIETLTQTPQRQKSNDPKNKSKNNDSTKSLLAMDDHWEKSDAIDSKKSTVDGSTDDDDDNDENNTKNKYHDKFPKKIPSDCGVVSILECITQNPIKNAKRRRRLTRKIKDFNRKAEKIRKLAQGKDFCYQPNSLPLQLNFETRVSFAYELTRMVFCIDASPTLTATFGNFGTGSMGVNNDGDGVVCAIDRVEYMSRLFFNALVQPIKGISRFDITKGNEKSGGAQPTSSEDNFDWFPQITVTVVACYPKSLLSEYDNESFSILVSDFHIVDMKSANVLCDRIAAWMAMEVESSIAQKFSCRGGRLDSTTSSLEQIVETCHIVDAATLPTRARPCFVIATDCRAIECTSVMDLVKEQNLKDVPLHVIDLSCGRTHVQTTQRKVQPRDLDMMFDYDGPSSFPLSISDDYEALFNACRSTRGYFFNTQLLKMAASTIAGEVPPESPFTEDVYFSIKRRTTKPNALQWYIAFTLSPCCQHRGQPPVPTYFPQQRRDLQRYSEKVTCLMYQLKPIRIKSILILRIMDGFRTRKYGSNSQDADKVSIQFTLNVEGGTVIKYEISFNSSRFHNAMVGNATVKIILSGEGSFIKMVQEQYNLMRLDPSFTKKTISARDLDLNKICEFLKRIRDEDVLESKLCPLDWDDKLTKDSEFLTNFHQLSNGDIYRHFRSESFEVIHTQTFNFGDSNIDEKKLVELITEWSTKSIKSGKLYLKRLPTTAGKLTNYCLVEFKKPSSNIRVSNISMHFFEQVDVEYRFRFLASLKNFIESSISTFIVAPRIVSKYINSTTSNFFSSESPGIDHSSIFQCQSWDLLSDPELFPLITRQRSEVDHFCPVLVTPGNAIFVKFMMKDSDLAMIQYSIKKNHGNVSVSLLMDCNKADFSKAFSRFSVSKSPNAFSEIYDNLIERDQRCASVLRSRRQLLNIFNVKSEEPSLMRIDQSENVDKLLSYAEEYPLKLRFFDDRSAKANKILEKMTIKFILSKTHGIEVVELLVGRSQHLEVPGIWFLVRSDNNIFGVLHFPFKESNNEEDLDSKGIRYRKLTMFVISTMKLYSPNDQVLVQECKERNSAFEYSEKIFSLIDQIEKAHGQNFSLSLYLALRDPEFNSSFTVRPLDFNHVLSYCNDIPIIDNVEIMSSFEMDDECKSFGEKLVTHISEILKPVPLVEENVGRTYFYFYRHMNQNYEIEIDSRDYEKETEIHYHEPIFLSFTIDGKGACLDDLYQISSLKKQSSVLNSFITSFRQAHDDELTTELLPAIQEAVASNLTMRLNSFVAEQTMERLRMEHKANNEVDFENVKKCLYEAENVVVSTIPIHFYFSKADTMIDASTSIGMEGGFQQKFSLLNSCISEQCCIPVIEMLVGEFFAEDIEEFGWCFIHVPESFGFVSIHCYHPAGIERADEIAMIALKMVSDACHCTNQTLLLEHMHRTRTASTLMLPEHNINQTSNDNPFSFRVQENNIIEYPAGYFQCDVSFKTSFVLNRRCKGSNVILELELSILHSFAISNRGGIFVYKDVDERIFYMKLERGKDEDPESVNFIVYGIKKAGPSITLQLKGLLQKKLMSLCTEAISRVLTKNPQFHLMDTDIQFIRNFSKEMKDDSKNEEIFAYPLFVRDPVMVLVYFRQNIIGSSFFNYVLESDQKGSLDEAKRSSERKIGNFSEGIPFYFDTREFSFYYNASQFLPGKKFQPISTLTEVGKQFSRKAGTGVALIEIRLLDSNKQPLTNFRIGMPSHDEIPTEIQQIKFKRSEEEDLDQISSNHFLSVRIINTTLDAAALHGWIELTLNQALISWAMERFLERSKLPSTVVAHKNVTRFGRMIRQSSDLPHPAAKKVILMGDVKSYDMPKLVRKLLEQIMNTMFGVKLRSIHDVMGLQTILCHGQHSRPVRLISKSPQMHVQTVDLRTNQVIPNHPATNQQYVSSFGLCDDNMNQHPTDKRKKSSHRVPDASFLFQRVRLFAKDAQADTLPSALEKLFKTNPHAFTRRIAFLFVVTRTSSSFYFYNWNPQAFDNLKSTLNETFNEFNTLVKSQDTTAKNATSSSDVKSSKHVKQSTSSKNSTSILMPTIVGKSVKGSAMQAVAMSRARASASRSNPTRSVISKSSKSASTTGKPTQRVLQKSTWKARNNKKISEPKKPQENDILLKNLPPTLAKEYMILYTSILKYSIKRSFTSMIYQQFLVSWLSKLKEKEISLPTVGFILAHANLVRVQTFALLQTVVNNPYQFLTYLAKVILSQDRSSAILAKTFSWNSQKDSWEGRIDPVIFVMRKVYSPAKKISMIIILEVGMKDHKKLVKICRYRCWSLISHKEVKNIDNAAFNEVMLSNLNVKGEVFNFVNTILERSLKYSERNLNLDVPVTLRASCRMFPTKSQIKTRLGNWFRQFHCRIVWEATHDFKSSEEFIGYLSTYSTHYGVISLNSGSVRCIGGKVMGKEEYEAHFFLVPCVKNEDESQVITLDLFVIVSATNNTLNLEKLFLEKKSDYFYTKKVSTFIMDECKKTILSIINMVSVDFRRDKMWEEQSDWV